MKLSSEKWHYKVLEWAYGESFFWRWVKDETGEYGRIRKQVSLCPYVDKLIIALALSPFIAIYKAVSYHLQLALKITGLGLFIPLFAGIIAFIVGVPTNWLLNIVIGQAVMWGVFGFVVLIDELGLFEPAKKEEKPEKKHEPSLLSSWLEAKHRRVCPLLEFE